MKIASVSLSTLRRQQEIRKCWHDEIAVLANFLLPREQQSNTHGHWKATSGNYKPAGVNTSHVPNKKNIKRVTFINFHMGRTII